jgi:hypothetical protein
MRDKLECGINFLLFILCVLAPETFIFIPLVFIAWYNSKLKFNHNFVIAILLIVLHLLSLKLSFKHDKLFLLSLTITCIISYLLSCYLKYTFGVKLKDTLFVPMSLILICVIFSLFVLDMLNTALILSGVNVLLLILILIAKFKNTNINIDFRD